MTQPVLYMIAGPNGAGKTTFALRTLPEFFSVYEFVNADEIARGMSPFNPDGVAVAAGRVMLERIDTLIEASQSFSFETTGASRGFAEKIKDEARIYNGSKAKQSQIRVIAMKKSEKLPCTNLIYGV